MGIIATIRNTLAALFLWQILVVVAVGSWIYAGKPFPGRYQIAVRSGDVGITMIDTATGRIRIFAVRRADSEYKFPAMEIVAVTK